MATNTTFAVMASGKEVNEVINHGIGAFVRSNVSIEQILKYPIVCDDIMGIDKSSIYDITENHETPSITTWYAKATNTQYFYSDADIIYFNRDCSLMFANCDFMVLPWLYIEICKDEKVSFKHVKNTDGMFKGCIYEDLIMSRVLAAMKK